MLQMGTPKAPRLQTSTEEELRMSDQEDREAIAELDQYFDYEGDADDEPLCYFYSSTEDLLAGRASVAYVSLPWPV